MNTLWPILTFPCINLFFCDKIRSIVYFMEKETSFLSEFTHFPSFLPVICFVIFLFFICLPLSAQIQAQREEFWISPGADIALYSPVSMSYGGSMTIAYGSGTSIGTKIAWFFDQNGKVNVLELGILFRMYFFENYANSRLFMQLAGGPAIYFPKEEAVSYPAKIGHASIGLAVGWRFLLGKYFFVEPSINGGYPFIVGTCLSAGVRL